MISKTAILQKLSSIKSSYIPDEIDKFAEELTGKYIKTCTPYKSMCLYHIQDAYINMCKRQKMITLRGVKHTINNTNNIQINISFHQSIGSLQGSEITYIAKEEFDAITEKGKLLFSI